MLTLIYIFTFLTICIVLYLIINFITAKTSYSSRIKKYINVQERAQKKENKAVREGLNIIGSKLTKLGIFEKYKIKVQKELTKAHILLKGDEFIAISLFCYIVLAFFVSLLVHNAAVGLTAGIAGWMMPSIFVKIKKKKRVMFLNEQIADAIVLISNSLKAGYSFLQAMDMVAKEMTPPISEEFGQVQKEINLGYTTEQALENLTNRVESEDLDLLIIAVLTQRQIGGNLAEILDNISGTIRDRLKIKGEIRTLTAQGRLSGIIIALVPVGLGLALWWRNPEYIGLLFTNPLGWAILGIAAVMEIVGIYSINKIINIEV